MQTQIILEPGYTFDGYWIDFLVNTAMDLMKGEFKEFFDNIPDTVKGHKVQFLLHDDLSMLTKDYLSKLDKFDADTISKAFNDYRHQCSTADAQAEFFGEERKGKFILTELRINFHYTNMCKTIMRTFDHVDVLKEFFTNVVRHELGHIMDFLSYHGRPIKEIVELRREYDEEKVEFYKSWEGKQFSKELSIKYNELGEEAIANINGNVDVNRMSEIEDIMSKLHPDTDIVLDITRSEIKHIKGKTEEENK